MAKRITIPRARAKNGKRRPSPALRTAYRKGRVQGWKDVLKAYLSSDGESFQDWLYTLTGHEE